MSPETGAEPTLSPLGDHGIRVHLAGGSPLVVAETIVAAEIPHIEDVLPAAETVLVTLTEHADLAEVTRRLASLDLARAPEDGAGEPADELVVPVRYDGPDLQGVADLLDMSPEALVRRHIDATWRCAFVGFSPGFGYLRADRPHRPVPRRDQSRPRIPPGSVGLADAFSGIYPRASPGGWQLIGSTDVVLWDLDRPEPAVIRPGTTVRFVDAAQRR